MVEIDSEKRLVEYKEKPTLNYQVSMGINVFKKNSVKNLLRNAVYLDIPDLMMGLKIMVKKYYAIMKIVSGLI